MTFFHRHRWTETERIVAERVGSISCERIDAVSAQRLAFGVTTIVLTCSECGDKKTLQALGAKAAQL